MKLVSGEMDRMWNKILSDNFETIKICFKKYPRNK